MESILRLIASDGVPEADVPSLAPAANSLDAALNGSRVKTVEAIDKGPQARPMIMVIEIGIKPQ